MAELLFYKEPVALNRDLHKEMRYQPITDFGFTKAVNSVPMTSIEFFEASRDLPILFSKDANDLYFPIALLSFTNEGHRQIDEDGKWTGNYIPAFIRRYPFVLNNEGTVCFDQSSHALSKEHETELFTEDGENTDAMKNILGFLQHYDAEHKRTVEFCEALAEKDLFKPFNLQIMGNTGEAPTRLQGLYVVDDQKFDQLDDEVVSQWFRKAYIAWVYAHLHSLSSIQKLAQKNK